MARAFIIILDSFGIGCSKDASEFDQGANTLGHIADDISQSSPLNLPNLCQLGLNQALKLSSGEYGKNLPVLAPEKISGAYGYAIEQSAGKDTPSGHWEIAGLPVLEDWGYFVGDAPCFPQELINEFIQQANIPGVLGECHASGTEILKLLGEEHIKTGKPIVYTSADSVFQIAAHETSFGLERLYELCEIARKLVDKYRIGRVIARPFMGESADSFKRTENRRDLATPPFGETLLDKIKNNDKQVLAIGKISDIFAGVGITQKIKAGNNQAGFAELLNSSELAQSGDLVFVNLNDFDSLYGHRRDVAGYAKALESFDQQLPEFINKLQPGDLAIIAADHGCDPTWPGSDHTREHIPVLAFGPEVKPVSIGARNSFADIGQTIAEHLGVEKLLFGDSFLSKIMPMEQERENNS